MTRIRVSELAKEFNVENKDMIDRITKHGILVKNHMSTLTDAQVLTNKADKFAEPKPEKVEESESRRKFIRRRMRNRTTGPRSRPST